MPNEVANDPTVPFTEIGIGGKTYKMCFDIESLADAEDALVRAGYEVNILRTLPTMNLSGTRTMFAASLRRFHPEIGFDGAKALLTWRNIYLVLETVVAAWKQAMPDVLEGDPAPDPPQPGN
jgi:hypothetical protein